MLNQTNAVCNIKFNHSDQVCAPRDYDRGDDNDGGGRGRVGVKSVPDCGKICVNSIVYRGNTQIIFIIFNFIHDNRDTFITCCTFFSLFVVIVVVIDAKNSQMSDYITTAASCVYIQWPLATT